MNDSFIHRGLRNKLVAKLKEKGISDEQVLAAIGKVPRHLFMDSSLVGHAYEDKPFSIGAGQTISQPYTVAFQTQLLQLKKWEKVLEVGTGSGYQTAVLMELNVKVFTIERQRLLYTRAQQKLHELGYFPMFFFGDGYEGKPSFAPFSKILVTAGAPQVPQQLLEQLAVGGRMVIPVGESGHQQMLTIDKLAENKYAQTNHGSFSFVPLLKGVNG